MVQLRPEDAAPSLLRALNAVSPRRKWNQQRQLHKEHGFRLRMKRLPSLFLGRRSASGSSRSGTKLAPLPFNCFVAQLQNLDNVC